MPKDRFIITKEAYYHGNNRLHNFRNAELEADDWLRYEAHDAEFAGHVLVGE